MLFRLFRKTRSQLFVVQRHKQLGTLQARSVFEDLGLAVGDRSRSESVEGQRYIGATISRKRLTIGIVLFLFMMTTFLARAAYLQIMKGESYAILAQENRYRTNRVVPSRGIIKDRNGVVLAQNVPSFVLTMTIGDLPRDPETRTQTFEHVARLTGLQPADIDLAITEFINNPHDPIPLQRNIAYETAIRLAIDLANLPGFALNTSSQRQYNATVRSMSHILGYTGKMNPQDLVEMQGRNYRPIDSIGKVGIEKTAESILRGVPGTKVFEVDARAKELAVVSKTEPIPGSDITLSIDLAFQKFIEERLQLMLEKSNATRGSVVAVDPRTGAVRALVSLPTFDNNLFAGGIDADSYNELIEDPDRPLFPRAVSGEFPSGSIFKPFVAYAALSEGVVSERSSFLSTGGIRINQWYFPDWKSGGHGTTDVRKAIAESVNTYFYIIGGGFDQTVGLGVNRISEYARKFGFGAQTGINLTGEADGFLPSKEWKEEAKGERWYVGDTYHLAIGQGDFLTTPLQMAVATGILANGGQTIEPYLTETVDGPLSNVDFTHPMTEIEDLDPYALSVVRQGMRQTITQGSARSLSGLPEAVAGKTGTAQTPGDRPYHSWFTGFGPYSNPNIALTVLVEEGGESNDAAVPLANELFWWWFTFGS